MNSNYCIILAGGKGRRLWPFSREDRPKQFIDLFGMGKTPLQLTMERFSSIFPKENIFITTNEEYVDIVREQVPDILRENIVIEPVQRNTAPCIAWTAHRIKEIDGDANIVVTPADTMVINEELFHRNISEAIVFVNDTDRLLTLGVKATRPETEYGYIQIGEVQQSDKGGNIFRVKSFTEKPSPEFAEMFISTGEFFWNTGIFISSVRGILNAVDRVLPTVFRNIKKENPNLTREEEDEFMKDNYSAYPNVSIDHGVLEKSDEVYVLTGEFGWADLGTWNNIYEQMPKDRDDNVILESKAILDNCKSNIIKIPDGKLLVANGLEDYIVVDDGEVLLICKKEEASALTRKYINDIKMKYHKFV